MTFGRVESTRKSTTHMKEETLKADRIKVEEITFPRKAQSTDKAKGQTTQVISPYRKMYIMVPT